MSRPTVVDAIAALLDACEFALEVLGSEEMGSGILDEDASQRFEAVLRLMHAMEQARAFGGNS